MKKLQGILLLMLMMLFATGALAQQSDQRTLLTINGKKISAGEFMRVYGKNNLNKEQSSPEAIREYLELYINFRLKVEEAEALGLDTLTSFRKELEGYRKQLAQPYFTDDSVKARLLREAYERSKHDIRASHILVRADRYASPADSLAAFRKIMDARARVQAGEDFGKVAAEVSEDPSARDSEASQYRPARKGNKGDLGYFTVFDMVYPFETAAYTTPVGQVSAPVRTDYGYHIIKVTDKQSALGQVQVAHIYIPIPNTAGKTDSIQKEMKINAASDKLKAGQPWAEVVREYSEDKGSMGAGGKLPWFGANRMVPEFIQATRKLSDTGQVSKPFLTPFGWHIIRLLDRKVPGSFDQELQNLQTKLEKDQRLKNAEDAVISRIQKENKFKEYPKARAAVLAVIDTSLLRGEWDVNKAAGMVKPVFSIGMNKYTQQDLAKYISAKQHKKVKGVEVFFNEMYSKFVRESCLAFEDSKLESKYEDFRLLMEEYHDGILLFDLTDQKVWSKAVKDTIGLHDFYRQNRNRYMWDERVDAVVVTLLHPELVSTDELNGMFSQSVQPEEILAHYNSDTLMVLALEQGKFSREDNPVIDAIPWKEGPSQIVDSEDGKAYAYIFRILPPEPKTLDESRGLITADYQAFLEEQWVKELRGKYPYSVDQQVLSTLK